MNTPSSTLNALDSVIERHGRGTLSDPIALVGALRSLPAPPPDEEITTLAAVAGTGAVERMRAVLEDGGGPDEARHAAVEAASGAGERAEWACDLLGAALGLLPRDADVTVTGDPSVTVPSVPGDAAAKGRRRGMLAAVGAVAALCVAAGATVVVLAGPGNGGTQPAAVSAAEPSGAPEQDGAPQPSAAEPAQPADPRAVFTDPDLLRAAEPYLDGPDIVCGKDEAALHEQESVACELGDGYLAIFKKLLNPSQLEALRTTWLTNNPDAMPGSLRTLRWEWAPERPGTRRGIPYVTEGQGDGTRIRWRSQSGLAHLYFDEDATGVAVLMMSATANGDGMLRAFWEGPE